MDMNECIVERHTIYTLTNLFKIKQKGLKISEMSLYHMLVWILTSYLTNGKLHLIPKEYASLKSKWATK